MLKCPGSLKISKSVLFAITLLLLFINEFTESFGMLACMGRCKRRVYSVFKTNNLYSIAFARWSWHLGSGLDQCANARLGVQIWHSRADRERFDSLTCSGHDQRANARSAHLIWHSRADREHLGFFYKKQSKKFKIGHTLGYLYLSVPFGNTLVKCSRSARECQIGCVDLAFARWSWAIDSLTYSGHNQRTNARSAHPIWHSRADREHLSWT